MAGTLPHQTRCAWAPRRSTPPSRWAASLRWWPRSDVFLHAVMVCKKCYLFLLAKAFRTARWRHAACRTGGMRGHLNSIFPRHPHLAWSSACREGLPLVAVVAQKSVKNACFPHFAANNLLCACTRVGRTLHLCAYPCVCAYLHESAVDSC